MRNRTSNHSESGSDVSLRTKLFIGLGVPAAIAAVVVCAVRSYQEALKGSRPKREPTTPAHVTNPPLPIVHERAEDVETKEEVLLTEEAVKNIMESLGYDITKVQREIESHPTHLERSIIGTGTPDVLEPLRGKLIPSIEHEQRTGSASGLHIVLHREEVGKPVKIHISITTELHSGHPFMTQRGIKIVVPTRDSKEKPAFERIETNIILPISNLKLDTEEQKLVFKALKRLPPAKK